MNYIHAFTVINGVLEDYSGNGGTVTIPSGVRTTLSQCSLGHRVFCKNESITELIFPEGLEEIGSEACYGCTNLISVRLPSTLKRIGDRAFTHCTKLSNIEIPSSVRTIGSGAFYDTLWLNSSPDGPFYIGDVLYCFKGSLPEPGVVTIRPGTKRIADYAFNGVKGMTGVEIPPTCVRIGSRAFQGCSDLKCMTIPESVSGIGGGLFEGCRSLESVVIPNCYIEPQPWLFGGCVNLKRLTIPEYYEGLYERLAPNLQEIRITGTSFSKRDRNWFVNPKTTIISTLPLSQFPKEAKLAAIFGFAKRYCQGDDMPEDYKKASIRYIRQQKKKYMLNARDNEYLKRLLIEESIFSEAELEQ